MSQSELDYVSNVDVTGDELVVHLVDGRTISVPLEWFPRLREATPEERADWRLIGRGVGIHWDRLDEDVSVRGLLVPD
ncbi:MAG: DUF2442 domain-containing protein [Chloroflexota bacterium]|nr:DUF2442 domain-containing protein [Chloroflexota bacterium]